MTRPPLARRVALAALAAGLLAAAVPAADVVILKDGFTIQGNTRKESETITDKATGQAFTVPKGGGFDMVDDGARVVVFSGHHKQLGAVAKDAAVRPDYKAYHNPIPNRLSNNPFPDGVYGFDELPDFDAKWRRTLTARAVDGFYKITQQMTYLDPYCCYVVSTTHAWTQTFRTSEMDPQKVRKLLTTHPTLAEEAGKPDPAKRLAIARFMLDAGWLPLAQEDLARVRTEFAGSLPKEAQDQLDKLTKDLDGAVAALAAGEAENALKAGRYKYAADLAAAFPHKTAPPKAVDRITKVQAELKTARDGAEAARRHLRRVLDEVGGAAGATPLAAAAGPAAVLLPAKALPPRAAALAAAGERVLAEVHPDTADRVALFVDLAGQAEKDRAAGRPAGKTAEELLAGAVSGWAKGRGGATFQPDAAGKVWAAREAVLAYQRAPHVNARTQVLIDYKRTYPLGLDELAQVISLLPPADPEDLAARTGALVRPGNGVPEGVYRRKSAPHGDHPAGVEYLVRVPPEYHHGRAYPVLIAVGPAGTDPERLLGALAPEADRHGYVLLAPVWAGAFGTKGGWEWKGEDHDFVTGALRDAVRHFTVDNDRVFLLGFGSGADMAMDVGASHPDLFAGVVPICPNPRWQGFFKNYWPNAQKLPFYVVIGQQAAAGVQNLRYLFEQWTPKGFPAIQVVYKGRGVEWFPAEVPVAFDWMNRKQRPTGAATLKLDATRRFRWVSQRPGDDRFYWLGAERIDPRHLADPARPFTTPVPASLEGDIANGNVVSVRATGVRTISVWLGKDMIDWSQPVKVSLNGQPLSGWRPRVLEPDMGVLLEDYWHRGDRRMLYLARLEVKNSQ